MTASVRPRTFALRPPRFGFHPMPHGAPHPPSLGVVAEANRAGPLAARPRTTCLTASAGPIARTPGPGSYPFDRATARTAAVRGPGDGRAAPAGDGTRRLEGAGTGARSIRPLADPAGPLPGGAIR